MTSSQNSLFDKALLTIKDSQEKSVFECIEIRSEQVIDYTRHLKALNETDLRQHLGGYITWISHHSSLFEDFEFDPEEIDEIIYEIIGEHIEPEDDGWQNDDESEIIFSVATLCIWIHTLNSVQQHQIVNQAQQILQEEHKAPEEATTVHLSQESLDFETVIDVLENMLFHDRRQFLFSDKDSKTLWTKVLLPDRTDDIPGKPIFEGFQLYHHRSRRQTKRIETLFEDMPTDSPPEILTPRLTDGLSFTNLYGMVNGLLHRVSMSPFSGKFVAFSFAVTFKGDRNVPQWFKTSVEQSPRVLEQDMNEWDTVEWSGLFGRLFAKIKTDKRWFVMQRIDRRIRAKLLSDAMGFDQIVRPNPEDKMTEIAQEWKRDYITLYVWPDRFRSPRVYLDFNGFRVRFRSTLDVRVILNSICRVIQIDTTDPVYDAGAKEVVNRLVASSTAELIEGDRIARMIFLNQEHFLQARREMEAHVTSSCFATFSPERANLTEDTEEVSKMADRVFDSVKQVIQSRPDFVDECFGEVANRG